MTGDTVYEPRYSNSWGIVIGINNYVHASPLEYACNDAEKFAELLSKRLAFPNDNIVLLKNEEATREKILSNFLELASDKVVADDRIIVFFAGHGVTQTGRRGEVGFLVPVDGKIDKIGSLIRWDELTRNGELIPAKHIFFVMDACYGGLAVQRYLPPGSMRFAKDMMQRYSRQVLTAGKADETVSDAGGPRPGHSVFTGHLLDALEGSAATTESLLTANGVMAYVYDKVARDYQSNQTPHYGFLDGDGDMILDPAPLEGLSNDNEIDKDILIQIPAGVESPSDLESSQSLSDKLKEQLSDPKHRIELHDLVAAQIRRVLSLTDVSSFPTSGAVGVDEIANRIRRYEKIVSELTTIAIMLGRWGGSEHRNSFEQIYSRLPDAHQESGGIVVWLGLRWYPIMVLMYAGGIAAVAADDYENLAAVLLAKVGKGYSGESTQPVVVPTVEGMLEADRGDVFKSLPGHDKHYAPRSEYLFKVVQPNLEDLLFLGRDYERLFDRFEILYALVSADRTYDERGGVWGPVGRFCWKYASRRRDQNPFIDLVSEAERLKENWMPLQAGLFDGSYNRFRTIADGYKELMNGLGWH